MRRMVAAIIVGESALEPPGRQNEDAKMTQGVQTNRLVFHHSTIFTIFHLEFLTNALQVRQKTPAIFTCLMPVAVAIKTLIAKDHCHLAKTKEIKV